MAILAFIFCTDTNCDWINLARSENDCVKVAHLIYTSSHEDCSHYHLTAAKFQRLGN